MDLFWSIFGSVPWKGQANRETDFEEKAGAFEHAGQLMAETADRVASAGGATNRHLKDAIKSKVLEVRIRQCKTNSGDVRWNVIFKAISIQKQCSMLERRPWMTQVFWGRVVGSFAPGAHLMLGGQIEAIQKRKPRCLESGPQAEYILYVFVFNSFKEGCPPA